MAREAVCSSTNEANGMRPLYANKAQRILIGCEQLRVNHPDAGAVQRGWCVCVSEGGWGRGAHLSACHSHKVFFGLRGARAKTCRLQPRQQEAYNIKPKNYAKLNANKEQNRKIILLLEGFQAAFQISLVRQQNHVVALEVMAFSIYIKYCVGFLQTFRFFVCLITML